MIPIYEFFALFVGRFSLPCEAGGQLKPSWNEGS